MAMLDSARRVPAGIAFSVVMMLSQPRSDHAVDFSSGGLRVLAVHPLPVHPRSSGKRT